MTVQAQRTSHAKPATSAGSGRSFSKVCALWLAGSLGLSQGYPVAAAIDVSAPAGERIATSTDGFALARPLGNFYDSVFVLTGPYGSAPRVIDVEGLTRALGSYDVAFFGEIHGQLAIHLHQLKLWRALHARRGMGALARTVRAGRPGGARRVSRRQDRRACADRARTCLGQLRAVVSAAAAVCP